MVYIINKRLRIPKWQSKLDNPDKLATQGTYDETKQKHNTLYVGHHYTQPHTNNVNKTKNWRYERFEDTIGVIHIRKSKKVQK